MKPNSTNMDSSEDTTTIPSKVKFRPVYPINIANIQTNTTSNTMAPQYHHTTTVYNINIHTSSSTSAASPVAAPNSSSSGSGTTAPIGVGTEKSGTSAAAAAAVSVDTKVRDRNAPDAWTWNPEAELAALRLFPTRLQIRCQSNIVLEGEDADQKPGRLMRFREDIPDESSRGIAQLIYHFHAQAVISRVQQNQWSSKPMLGSHSTPTPGNITRPLQRVEAEKAAIRMEDLFLKVEHWPLPSWKKCKPLSIMGDLTDRMPSGFNNSDLAYLLVNCLINRRPQTSIHEARELYSSGFHCDFGKWLPAVTVQCQEKLSTAAAALPAIPSFKDDKDSDEEEEAELADVIDPDELFLIDSGDSAPKPKPKPKPAAVDVKAPPPSPSSKDSIPKEMLMHPALPDQLLGQVVYVPLARIVLDKYKHRTIIPGNTNAFIRPVVDELSTEFKVLTPHIKYGKWLAVNWSGNKQQLVAQILLSPASLSLTAFYTHAGAPTTVGRLWLIATPKSDEYTVVFIEIDVLDKLYNSMLTHVFTADKPQTPITPEQELAMRKQPTIKLGIMHKIKESETPIHKLVKTKAGQTASSSSSTNDEGPSYRIQETFTNHPEISAPALFFAASWYSWFSDYLSYIFERHFKKSWGKEDIVKFIRDPNWVTKFTVQHYNSIPLLICMAAGYCEDDFMS